MAGSIDQTAYLFMQLVFALMMFAGCYFSYILPIRILQRKSRSGHRPLNQTEDTSDTSSSVGQNSSSDRRDWDEDIVELVVGLCNCFGSGVFLSVCFMAVLPVVREEFDVYFQLTHTKDVHYPVAEFCSLIGFFLVLFLEELVSACSTRQNKSQVVCLDEQSLNEEGLREGLLEPEGEDVPFEELKLEDDSHTHSHSHAHSHTELMKTTNGFTFFILMFATSIHSVFEGMALGLIREYSRALHLFIGIILHECIVAVALGLNSFRLQSSQSSYSPANFGLIFSATIPVGILIGVAVGYTPGPAGRLTSAIFQGLAAGTFLHVTFCELIPGELNKPSAKHSNRSHSHEFKHTNSYRNTIQRLSEKRIFRILLIFKGFLFMSIVTLFIDH